MKYWAYFAAKLLVAGALLSGVWTLMHALLPAPEPFMNYQFQSGFGVDLTWTTAYLLFFLCAVGVLALVVIDQRYRCRTCLRKLRMPVETGSWPNMFLLGKPKTEYICAYGHGTLKVPEVQIDGREDHAWHANDDIWKELTKK